MEKLNKKYMGLNMNKNIQQIISKKTEEIKETIINTRRHLHMYPELSGEEKETSLFIAEKLNALGMEVKTNIGGYGVVGILRGGKQGATIAWRADIDACAMREENEIPYKSKNDGIMHLCGHDAHTAIALGVAEVLSSVKNDLYGTIKFIFQPFEEGAEGALRMIKDGALENPRPSAIYGLHQSNWGLNQTYLEAGTISINYGTALFGYDNFHVSIKNTQPKINLQAEQEHFIYMLNKLDIRIIDKSIDYENKIFSLQAQFRCAKHEYRDKIREELIRKINKYAENMSSETNIEYTKSIPPVYNRKNDCKEALLIFKQLIGNNVIPIFDELPPLAADDFSLFQNELSGLFFFLGSANIEKGIKSLTHTANFNIDEDCLTFGVKTMSSFLFEILERKKSCKMPYTTQVHQK
jgi:metal-dependent amidase/aminoacylase/carboxypeptidase family protein